MNGGHLPPAARSPVVVTDTTQESASVLGTDFFAFETPRTTAGSNL